MTQRDVKEEFVKAADRMRKIHMGHVFKELSQGEFFAMEIIRKGQEKEGQEETDGEEGIFVSELAKKLRVSAPAASRMLRNLEEKDLIRREVDRGDRRNTYVYLTEKGREKRAKAAAAMDEFSGRVMNRMGPDDVESLIRLIEKMTLIMEDELSKCEKGDQG